MRELGVPIWFEPYQSYRQAGDLIWTTSESEPIPGFVGLGVNSSSTDTDVSNPYPLPSFSFFVRPHVVDALTSAEVTDLKFRAGDGSRGARSVEEWHDQ